MFIDIAYDSFGCAVFVHTVYPEMGCPFYQKVPSGGLLCAVSECPNCTPGEAALLYR